MLVYLVVLLVILFTLLGTLVFEKKPSEGLFIEYGHGNGGQTLGWSKEGINWTAAVDSDGGVPFGNTGTITGVDKGNGVWVAVGKPATGTMQIMWSDDGKTWNDTEGSKFGSDDTARGRFVMFRNGIWVAGGSNGTGTGKTVLTSTDGKYWKPAVTSPFGEASGATVSSISYLNGRWYIGGNGGTGNGTVRKIMYSEDGMNWNYASGIPFGTADNSNPIWFAYGNGVYVSVGSTTDAVSKIWLSTDGVNWSVPDGDPFASAGTLWKVMFYDDIFVTVGEGPLTAWSTDGNTWNIGTVDSAPDKVLTLLTPSYSGQPWFMAGEKGGGTSGAGYYSTDGKTWVSVDDDLGTNPISGSATGWTGAVGDSTLRSILGPYSSTTESVYYSDDRINWTRTDSVVDGTDHHGIVYKV